MVKYVYVNFFLFFLMILRFKRWKDVNFRWFFRVFGICSFLKFFFVMKNLDLLLLIVLVDLC